MPSQTKVTTDLGVEIEGYWAQFQRYLEWSEGFSLGFLFSSNRTVIDEFRQRLERVYHEPIPVLQQEDTAQPQHLLEQVLRIIQVSDDCQQSTSVPLWIEALTQDTGKKPNDRQLLLARLNERRELLRRNIQRPFILVLPSGYQQQTRETAPDLWSIRDFSRELLSESHSVQQVEPHTDRVKFSGVFKLLFSQRLGADWRGLADLLEIPLHQQRRFLQGDEARAIWEWLENRDALSRLPAALNAIHRTDLAEEFFRLNPSSRHLQPPTKPQ